MAILSSIIPLAYIIPPLRVNNYATFSVKIEMLLIKSELWQVVDGTEANPRSSDSEAQKAWKLKDSKARFDIIFRYSEKKIISFNSLKSSKEVWELFKQIYE